METTQSDMVVKKCVDMYIKSTAGLSWKKTLGILPALLRNKYYDGAPHHENTKKKLSLRLRIN